MSNGRSYRRRLATTRTQIAACKRAGARFPARPPAVGTVRRWLKAGEKNGTIERKGVARTGKPGRPAQMWGLTEAGKERPVSGTFAELMTDLRARRAYSLMRRHGVSERRAIAAVTRNWPRPGKDAA